MTHHSPRYSVSILPHGDKYYRFGRSFSGTHTLGMSRLLPYWNMLGRMSTQSLPAEDQGGLQQTVADNVRRRAGYLDFSRSDVARHLGVTPATISRKWLGGRAWSWSDIERLAVDAGLRRGEIAQVHESDVHPDLLGFSLLVHGKGGKLRLVPLLDDLAEQVMAACQAGGGHAFPGRIDGHLSAARVGELLTALLPPKITPHSFRHRFAANVYDETGDLLTVQTLLGHSSPETTRRYVPPNTNRLRAAVVAAAAA